MLSVYVNVSENATFHVQINESQRISKIDVQRSFGSIYVFKFYSSDWRHLDSWPYNPQYRDRVELAVDFNVTDGMRSMNLTIADIQLKRQWNIYH